MTPAGQQKAKAAVVPVVFLLLAAFICFEALLVPVGTIRMPGAGFFPLVLGVTLGVLSVVLLGMGLVSAPGESIRVWPEQREVLYLVGSVIVAIALFERLGFVPMMALFLAATMRTLGASWARVIALALVGSLGAYVVFGRLLQIALPSGLLPF